MSKKKTRVITHPMQEVAVSIAEDLAILLMTKDKYIPIEKISELYKSVMERFKLDKDPYTTMPCTTKEYVKNSIQIQRDIMMEKYGHHDGI